MFKYIQKITLLSLLILNNQICANSQLLLLNQINIKGISGTIPQELYKRIEQLKLYNLSRIKENQIIIEELKKIGPDIIDILKKGTNNPQIIKELKKKFEIEVLKAHPDLSEICKKEIPPLINELKSDRTDIEYKEDYETIIEELKKGNVFLIEELKKVSRISERINKENLIVKRMPSNILILYGPPGNGKTTYATKVAELTNSYIIEEDGPSIVEKFIGSGPKRINEVFKTAIEISKLTKKRVIIFIDEVDAFARTDNTHEEHIATATQLNLNITKHADKNLVVILATNKFESLNPALKSRIKKGSIEILNPDVKMRKEIIEYYFKEFNLEIEEDGKILKTSEILQKNLKATNEFISLNKILDKLVEQTEGFSIRDLVAIIEDLADSKGKITKLLFDKEIEAIKKRNEVKKQENQNKTSIGEKFTTVAQTTAAVLGATASGIAIYDRATKKDDSKGQPKGTSTSKTETDTKTASATAKA